MDSQLNSYVQTLCEVVREWGETGSSLHPIDSEIICDLQSGNVLLVGVGWRKEERIHNMYFHARVRQGKIWIEWDGIDPSIIEELLQRGIPRDIMVFGFLHPSIRSAVEPDTIPA
jgi:hypothetical protein